MSWLESLLLGLLQGLTEYLPISSSGHLAIASSLFGIDGEQNMAFTVLVHVATVLSTLVILWKEIIWIFRDLFSRQSWKSYSGLNEGTRYAINIIISMIPVGIVGLFFKDSIEAVFGSGTTVVGCCLLVTAALLTFSYYAKPRNRDHISGWHAFIIGIAQAVAVLPGISRSGSTIATGIILGNRKDKLAQFSFLMVIPPPGRGITGYERPVGFGRNGIRRRRNRYRNVSHRFPRRIHIRMRSLQMDDFYRPQG